MWLKALERRGLESSIGDASAFGRWLIENTGGDTSSGVNVSEGLAMQLTYVYACVNVLSQTLAHVPLELLKDGNKGSTKATRHPLWGMIANTPNSDFSSYTWRETVEAHRDGWGNGYSRIIRDGAMPVGLEILYPDRTSPKRLQHDGSLIYVSQTKAQKPIQIPAADMIHVAGLGFDGLQGYSPIHQARETVGLGLAIHKFGGSFFGNGASPKGVIESEVPANSLAGFADEFRKQYGSLEKAHGTPVLPKGLTYKPISVNPDDAQTLDTLKFNRTEICGLFRVPPQFVMDLERSTFTNAAEMDLHFVKHTMVPIYTNWEAELNRKLLTEKERRLGYHFKFNVNGLLRGSTKERFDSYHVALQDGWISRNEVRQLEDKPWEDGLDEFLTPNNMVASGEDSEEEPAPEIEAAPVEVDSEEGERFMPLIISIAERMASKERRQLERAGDDPDKIAKLYVEDYPEFIKRTITPTVEALKPDCGADDLVLRFTQRYIESRLAHRVGDGVNEAEIVAIFKEVMNG